MNQSTIASSNYNTTARYKLYLSNLSNGQSFSPNCPRQLVPWDTRIAKLITDIDCPLLSPVIENFIPRYLLICLHFYAPNSRSFIIYEDCWKIPLLSRSTRKHSAIEVICKTCLLFSTETPG